MPIRRLPNSNGRGYFGNVAPRNSGGTDQSPAPQEDILSDIDPLGVQVLTDQFGPQIQAALTPDYSQVAPTGTFMGDMLGAAAQARGQVDAQQYGQGIIASSVYDPGTAGADLTALQNDTVAQATAIQDEFDQTLQLIRQGQATDRIIANMFGDAGSPGMALSGDRAGRFTPSQVAARTTARGLPAPLQAAATGDKALEAIVRDRAVRSVEAVLADKRDQQLVKLQAESTAKLRKIQETDAFDGSGLRAIVKNPKSTDAVIQSRDRFTSEAMYQMFTKEKDFEQWKAESKGSIEADLTQRADAALAASKIDQAQYDAILLSLPDQVSTVQNRVEDQLKRAFGSDIEEPNLALMAERDAQLYFAVLSQSAATEATSAHKTYNETQAKVAAASAETEEISKDLAASPNDFDGFVKVYGEDLEALGFDQKKAREIGAKAYESAYANWGNLSEEAKSYYKTKIMGDPIAGYAQAAERVATAEYLKPYADRVLGVKPTIKPSRGD